MEVTTWVEAPWQKGRVVRFSEHAGRNVSERRAGLETVDADADPPEVRGRPVAGREASDESTDLRPPG